MENAARKKLFSFYEGLNAYANYNVDEWQPEAKVIWQEGSTRILDYGNGKGQKILFISPLINRANILDLSGDKSLMRFLASLGYQPLLVDWGNLSASEKEFGSDDYAARLARFSAQQKDLVIGGYCMGGLLALKLAKLVQHKALILLATPWNFHAPDVKRVDVSARSMEKLLEGMEYVPPEFIQSLFMTADVWRVYNKYSKMGEASSQAFSNMMEIEHWVNNGVLMSVPMAKECIVGWSLQNTPGKGKWLDLKGLDAPVFLGCPTKDLIVPIGCSIPLLGLLNNSELYKFDCGHIGMMTRKLCFSPIATWLNKVL